MLTIHHQHNAPHDTPYMNTNPPQHDLHSDTTQRWGPLEAVSVQEPRFVPTPGSTREDDGVIVVGGFDARKMRGLLVVINATTMATVATVTAPQHTPYGVMISSTSYLHQSV